MHRSTSLTEDHELPAVEAVLAGTLALMTGYSQALQAELHPQQRMLMGRKIGTNLVLLADHPALTEPFQRILLGLSARWQAMCDCTEGAALSADAADAVRSPCPPCAAPTRLQ